MPPIPLQSGEPTYEQVDQHVRSLHPAVFAGVSQGLTDPIEVLHRVHDVYQAVRPIIQFVAASWILPRSWRNVLTVFLSVLDGIEAT